jgi:His-Xaa-Ser system radical SAM maturase HxsC
MKLHTVGVALGFQKPIVARAVIAPVPFESRGDSALILKTFEGAVDLSGYAAVISEDKVTATIGIPTIHSVRSTEHLSSGHIIAIEPSNGYIRTLYRPDSYHNTLFVTERCNSNCLMCSQPPIEKDDIIALTERNLRLIDLISASPEYLCITGGEPTLLGEHLLRILSKLRDKFPSTYVHMLTNGRRFAWQEFATELADVQHPNLSVGIPLYADHASLHDYVVQARNAFDQTILGLHQLARHGIEIEVRIVLHALTIPRLIHLAEYICRNLTFVDRVAFMGMEHIGHAPQNMDQLWIDPVDYQPDLEAAICVLARFGIDARIYNLQLCVMKETLWKYSRQAISDWKNAYRTPCRDCEVQTRCGGFFQWVTETQSRGVHPIKLAQI